MNNYKSFTELKEELGNNYDFKLYEMGISALKEIEKLQQENSQLKGSMETYDILLKSNVEENKQLKDNWNYIKKMLKEARQEKFNINGYCGTCTDVDIDFLLNKMQELEGSGDK